MSGYEKGVVVSVIALASLLFGTPSFGASTAPTLVTRSYNLHEMYVGGGSDVTQLTLIGNIQGKVTTAMIFPSCGTEAGRLLLYRSAAA